MPTNRDIQIQLKLKDQFSKKYRTAMQKMRRVSRSVATFMRKHWLKLAAAIAAVTYAVIRGMKSAINYVVELDKMAKQADITTGQFARLAYAAEQEHTSMDTLTKVFPILTKYMEYARQGQEMYLREFRKMGIDVADGTGKLKTTNKIFLEMADYYSNAKDKTKALAIAVTLLGRRGAELVPMLKLGRKGLEELGDEAERLGLVVDDETAAAFKVFTDQITKVKMALKGMWIRVAAKQMEYMTTTVEKLAEFKWDKIAQHISSYIDKIREVVFATGRWIKKHTDLLKIIGKTAAIAAAAAVLITLSASLITSTVAVYGFVRAIAVLTGVNLVQLSTACYGLIGTLIGAGGLAAALGLVGAAGATAFVGWKIGEAIAKATKLDKWLEKLYLSMMKVDVKTQIVDINLLAKRFGGLSEELQKYYKLVREGMGSTDAYNKVLMDHNKALDEIKKKIIDLGTITVTAKLPDPFAGAKEGWEVRKTWQEEWEKFYEALPETQLAALDELYAQRVEAMGKFAELDQWYFAKRKEILSQIKKAEEEINKWQVFAAERTYNAMADSFKSIFVGTLKGELETAADYFNAFRNSMINMIADIMAQWAAMKLLKFTLGGSNWGEKILGSLFGSGGSMFHQGGMIRAHNGLAMDEIPIIAQSGEGVLSRRGMANLGGSGALNRLNRGQEERDEPQTVIHNHYNINLLDAEGINDDFFERNKARIGNAAMSAMDDNHPSRRGL